MDDMNRRGSLLILSRSDDLMAPLVHSYFMQVQAAARCRSAVGVASWFAHTSPPPHPRQSLAYDAHSVAPTTTLPLSPGSNTVAEPDEDDEWWAKYRYRHLNDLVEGIKAERGRIKKEARRQELIRKLRHDNGSGPRVVTMDELDERTIVDKYERIVANCNKVRRSHRHTPVHGGEAKRSHTLPPSLPPSTVPARQQH